jgi:hypothetical protein
VRITLLMPVMLTGLAFLGLLTVRLRQAHTYPFVGLALVSVLAVCLIGSYSIWQFHLPMLIKLIVSLLIGSLATVVLFDFGEAGTRFLLLVSAILMSGFCLVAIASVGMLFVPSAIALSVAAARVLTSVESQTA